MSGPKPIIVVGAGTAGCTVATYLANNTNQPILVVEPGQYGNDDESRFLNFSDTNLLTTTMGGYVQASAIGGGSAVNGLLLTGEEPQHLKGLTRVATAQDIGMVGDALLAVGGRFSRLWWNGGRWNPGRALRHLIEANRVSYLPHSVTGLLHENGRVSGVHCGEESIAASAVVLCAGAIATPGILLSSDVQKLNPAIGQGLQNHPTVTAQFPLAKPQSVRFDAAVVREWSTANGGQMLNIAYERVAKNHDELGALSVSFMNPMSRGRVEISLDGEVAANFHYLEDEGDTQNMIAGVRDLMSLFHLGNFCSEIGNIAIEGRPLAEIADWDDSELASWMHSSVKGVSHAAASCAEAVDISGRVMGLDNCWVADASALPSVPTVTPAGPVTMEALRIARNIGESLS